MTVPVLEQVEFRARGDTVGLNVDTWDFLLNGNFNQAVDTVFRIRFTIAETAGGMANNIAFSLQYNLNGAGFVAIGDTAAVRSALSGQFAHLDPTEVQLISTGSYIEGVGVEQTTTTNISLVSSRTEIEWALSLDSGQVSAGDTIQLRVVQDTGTVLDVYTVTPTITAGTEVPEVVSIIDAGGGQDYVSAQAWEAGEQRDLVLANERAVGKARTGEIGPLDINGWVTDANRKIILEADAGHEPNGLASAGPKMTAVSGSDVITARHDCRFENLVLISSDDDGIQWLTGGGGVAPEIIGCVIVGNATGGDGIGSGSAIVNNIIYGFTSGAQGRGILVAAAGDPVYNNTIVGCRVGIRNCEVIVNNISTGNSLLDYTGSGGTTDLTNLDTTDGLVFVDAANDDYHLAAGDTVAIDTGTDLSADATYPFSTDIDGDARPAGAWDIGADQIAAAGNTASGASALPSLASAAQGELILEASGASTLPAIQQAGQTFFGPDASGAQALPAIVQNAAAELILEANGVSALPSMQQVAQALLVPDASGAQALPSILTSGDAFRSPTPLGAINEAVSLDVDTIYLVAVRIENTGAIGGTDFKWQFNRNSTGWVDVTTTAAAVQAVNATTFANDDDVPERLGGSGTYIADNNAATEDGSTSLTAGFTADGAAEFVLAFKLPSSEVANDDTIQLRLVQGDGTEFTTYTQTPTITVVEAGAVSAAGASLLQGISSQASADLILLASGSQALPAIGQAASAFFGPDVAGAQALPSIVQSAAAELILEIAGASILPALEQTGVGFLLPKANGAQALPSLLTSGAVTVAGEAPSADGASLLPAIASQASAELVLLASGASILPSLQQQGSLEEILAAAGASILPSIQSEGSGAFGPDVAGASVLPGIQAAAVVVLEIPGVGACILPAIRTEGNAFLVPDAAGAMVLPSIRQLAIAELVGAVVKKEGQVSLLQRLSQNRLSWRF